MKRIFLILLIIFILSGIVLISDHYSKSQFLEFFFINQALSIMGTILALNFALGASLQAILINIETFKNKTNLFLKTRKEIKHNTILMIILFILFFMIQVATPKFKHDLIILRCSLKFIKTILFFIYLYAVYEMSNAVFFTGQNNK